MNHNSSFHTKSLNHAYLTGADMHKYRKQTSVSS
jgi:hypothetical protein